MANEQIPAMVRPTVEGYFRIPAVWVATPPTSSTEVAEARRKIMCQHKFQSGMLGSATQNGTFFFDFLECTFAPVVVVPSWVPSETRKPPKRVVDAYEQAEVIGHLRAQILNAHQACLQSAESLVMSRGAHAGFPIAAWSTIKTFAVESAQPFQDDHENLHALAQQVLDGRFAEAPPNLRRLIEVEVVKHSFELLDRIIATERGRLLPIIEAAYQAANRSIEMRFGEAIAIGWTACEQLVSHRWHGLLKAVNSQRPEESRFSRQRLEKLNGRDYTASVMVEMLDVSRALQPTLYENLEKARKARNNWAHDMKTPDSAEIDACLSAIKLMLSEHGIHLNLTGVFRSGGPTSPVANVVRLKGGHPNLVDPGLNHRHAES